MKEKNASKKSSNYKKVSVGFFYLEIQINKITSISFITYALSSGQKLRNGTFFFDNLISFVLKLLLRVN